MWELVATAVAGLNAGAGLQAALAGTPGNDPVSFTRFAGRSRMLGLLLSTVATSSCLTAFYGESRGALWLAAAAGTGLLIPFNLLMMAPPTAVVTEGSMSPRVRFAQDEPASELGSGGGAAAAPADAESAEGGARAAGSEPGAASSAFANGPPQQPHVLSSATIAPQPVVSRRRSRLMYSKSGLLVSPSDFASSWSKKFWFSAALSLTAFGCMIAMIGSGKDAATYGYAPF